MANRRRAVLEELKAAHAVLVRHNGKHEVWRLPNGSIITVSRTASDRRALLNIKGDIRRGMNNPRKEQASGQP